MQDYPSEPAQPKAIIPLLPYQREDVESEARFRWNCWSRQTGKSFTKSLRRILRGLSRRRTQIFLSAGERQSRELMAKARQHCEALKIATEYYDDRFFKELSVKQLEIVLPGGGPVPLLTECAVSICHTLCLYVTMSKADPLVGGSSACPPTRRPRRGSPGMFCLMSSPCTRLTGRSGRQWCPPWPRHAQERAPRVVCLGAR